jgi:hypothetical protein
MVSTAHRRIAAFLLAVVAGLVFSVIAPRLALGFWYGSSALRCSDWVQRMEPASLHQCEPDLGRRDS